MCNRPGQLMGFMGSNGQRFCAVSDSDPWSYRRTRQGCSASWRQSGR